VGGVALAPAPMIGRRSRLVIVTLPLPLTTIVVALRPEPVIGVAWPRVRVTPARQPPSPAVIVLPARPQGMQRGGKVLRIWSPPPRRG
jgi:hypothetical protein